MREDQTVTMPPSATPESAALSLLQLIARAEGKFFDSGRHPANTDRQWILETYAECLSTIRGVQSLKAPRSK